MKDRAQPFKGHIDRLVQRSFGVDAMCDINGFFCHAILSYRGAIRLATDLAGTPTTVPPAGTSPITTAPAPTMLAAPTLMPWMMLAPVPMWAPFPTWT